MNQLMVAEAVVVLHFGQDVFIFL